MTSRNSNVKKTSKMLAPFGAAVLACAVGNAGAAETDVSFYGLLDVWAGSLESPAANDGTTQLGSGGMSTSFLGLTIVHPLTDDLKAIAGVEMFFRPDTGDSGRYGGDEFFARGAYIGLDGGFGQVKAGRNTAPYFLPVVFTNPFGDSFVFSPSILHTYAGGVSGPTVGDSGWSNSVSYTTPDMSGLRATAVYAFGEREGTSSGDKIGGNLIYRSGPMLLTLSAYDAAPNNSAGELGGFGALGPTDQKGMLVGGAYDFGVVKAFGQYQMLDTDVAGGDFETDTYQLGVSVPVGPGSVLASYALSDFTGVVDTERKTLSLGYNWLITKKVDLYAVAMHDDIENVGDGNSFGIGGRYRF